MYVPSLPRGFHSLISQGITHPSIYPPVLSSMHRHLYSSSVRPSISCCINPHMHPPPASRRVIQWTHYFPLRKQEHHLAALTRASQRSVKVWRRHKLVGERAERREEEVQEWGGRTGRVQVSGPIGVRRCRLHLPKQTAQRSRVLHLSLWITPLSHPPVPQCPIPSTHYSKFMQHAEWWGLWNVKLQQGSVVSERNALDYLVVACETTWTKEMTSWSPGTMEVVTLYANRTYKATLAGCY